MRLAAIDIGTNSIHMIVVRVRDDRSFEVIDREKVMVRLGAGGLDGKALTRKAVAASLRTLATFKRLADAHGVDEILAVATSATREAPNGGEFLARIEREIGIRAQVITGAEEARLIHLAATYGVHIGSRNAVVVDVGGGSVEITLGNARTVRVARSFKLGVIRLTERFVRTDPLSRRDERRLVKHIRSEIDRPCRDIAARGFDHVIGTSGTLLSLGAMATAHVHGAPPTELRNLRVPAKALRRVRKTLVGLPLAERLSLPGIDPRRADLAVAGAILADTVLRRLGAEEITLCDLALREGLILDYIQRHQRRIAHVDSHPDVRRRSALELAERCTYLADHAAQVARLALAIFDHTRRRHRLGDREREWLDYAALMHDLGTHISFARHHRHSYYLIKNGDLRGFEPEEIDVIALVARYHRRSVPKATHEEFAPLPGPLRRTVEVLAAMLRVAEGLDRSHASVVSKMEVRKRRPGLVLTAQVRGDAELEVWAASRHLEPLAHVLGCPVSLTVRTRLPSATATRRPASRRAAVR
jgi:exopolyphosphatase / guanosine-5'-triphosphate,3'-diphosphate pyrophosphatase